MENLRVFGGQPLNGKVVPAGNKNASLPILCATLLTSDEVTLHNLPDITDVRRFLKMFEDLGSEVSYDPVTHLGVIRHRNLSEVDPEQIPAQMRSSILLFSSLTARVGEAKFHSNTKGCALGLREVDPHIYALKSLGYEVDMEPEGFTFRKPMDRPSDDIIYWLDYASVTATENFIMGAVVGKGRATLHNAACEPHVQDLCHFLKKMGAKIKGIGTNRIIIEGVEGLNGCEHRIIDDHHEIASFLAIGAMTAGKIEVEHNINEHMGLIYRQFQRMGIEIEHDEHGASVEGKEFYTIEPSITPNAYPKIEAAPWPYLPADLLPPFIALGVACKGDLLFWNKVYEGALHWIPELTKFGAFAHVTDPHSVIIKGGLPLRAATSIECPYIIRACIALLMVALRVEGESVLHNASPIMRAHPNFAEKLRALGCQVTWE
ncbi:MAG: UDP-N-acetylglucosamine 1-carboxyvinyltransferase [Verrucomicrobiales bacterium]|nr:UDP-N-acetylglucosamine 1-carboxyvinyltransferase [Verrucomicrobiales bacterium]